MSVTTRMRSDSDLNRYIASLERQHHELEVESLRLETAATRAIAELDRVGYERCAMEEHLRQAEILLGSLSASVRANNDVVRRLSEKIDALKAQIKNERLFWSTVTVASVGALGAVSIVVPFTPPVVAAAVAGAAAGGGLGYVAMNAYNTAQS